MTLLFNLNLLDGSKTVVKGREIVDEVYDYLDLYLRSLCLGFSKS